MQHGLETKYACLQGTPLAVQETAQGDQEISGYASLFGTQDQGGDIVVQGAYRSSLGALQQAGRRVKMLWQHDPSKPIGIWDEVYEDAKGLWVKGRILNAIAQGREAAALIAAQAIEGLSIGYRTVKAAKNDKGQRLLQELELWEVSLVTFPMLPSARVGAKSEAEPCDEDTDDATLREVVQAIDAARAALAEG